MISAPGVIKKTGPMKTAFWIRTASIYKLKALQSIFKKALIESYLVDDIVKKQFGKIHIHFGIGISHLLFESKHR
jgi:2-dehydropantoate 2-reductase